MQFSRLKAWFLSLLFWMVLAIAPLTFSATPSFAQTPAPQPSEKTTPEKTEKQPRQQTETDQKSVPQKPSSEAEPKQPNPKAFYDPEAIKAFDRQLYGAD